MNTDFFNNRGNDLILNLDGHHIEIAISVYLIFKYRKKTKIKCKQIQKE